MERAILGGAVTDFLPIQWKDAPGVGLSLASPDMLYKERTPKTNLRGSQSGGYLLSHGIPQCSTEGTDVYCRVVLINYHRSGVTIVLRLFRSDYIRTQRKRHYCRLQSFLTMSVFCSLLDADAGCVVPIVSVTDEELTVHDHFLCVIGAEEEFFNPFGYRFEVISLAVEEGHSVEVVFS